MAAQKTPNHQAPNRGQPAARPASRPQTAPPARPQSPRPQTPREAPPERRQPGTQVAARPSTAVATSRGQEVPDYIRRDTARGSEDVSMQDLVIPRIELVQALSPCLEEGKAEYIEGAKSGMLYNSVTRELYGDQVTVCPVYFRKQFLAWRDRKKGGGFGGAHDSLREAQDRIAEQENPDEWEAMETAQQIVLVVDTETYDTSEAVVSMARTKMKVSRQWNSLIRQFGFDRFSRLYELFGVDETNSVNQEYKNLAVRALDFAPVEVYKRAEALYNAIASGERKVTVDDKYDDYPIEGEAAPPNPANTEY